MTYNYLNNWDIKLIKENMTDLEDLLLVIDDLIGVASDNAYNDGYENGYHNGFEDDHSLNA